MTEPNKIITNLDKNSRAKVCIITKNNVDQYLLLLRYPDDYYRSLWECPGGKYEEYESLEDCVKRELREETGITKIISMSYLSYSTFFEEKSYKTVYVFFYLVITNEEVTKHPEHLDYQWCSKSMAIELIPFKDPILAILGT